MPLCLRWFGLFGGKGNMVGRFLRFGLMGCGGLVVLVVLLEPVL